jgi:myosin-crossreactive antigen
VGTAQRTALGVLWECLVQGCMDFGNPNVFVGTDHVPDTQGLHDGDEILRTDDRLTGDKPGSGGPVTLKDSSWLECAPPNWIGHSVERTQPVHNARLAT